MVFGIFVSIIYASYSFLKKYNAIYFLPTFLLLNAIGDIFTDENEVVKWLKYAIIMLVLFRMLNFRAIKKYFSVFVFLGYLLIVVFLNSSDFFYSLKMYLILFFTFLMLPVSEVLMMKSFSEKQFLKNLTFMMVLMPLYLVIANIYGGESLRNSYSEDFAGGLLSTTGSNLFPIVILSTLFYIITKRIRGMKKYISIGLVSLSMISLILIFRRTPIIMLLLSSFIFIYYYKAFSFSKGIILLTFLSSFLLTNSKISNIFNAQLAARERISTVENYANEGRVIETFLVLNYIKNEATALELFFGSDALSTKEFGKRNFRGTRTIHGDISSLFVSVGVVGIFLFFYVVRKFIIKTIPKGKSKGIYISLLLIFLLTLIPGRFISSLTFSLPIFLFLGYFRFLGNVKSNNL